MIRSLIKNLLVSKEEQKPIVKDLRLTREFCTEKENREYKLNQKLGREPILDTGKVESIPAPDLGDQGILRLTKWYIKPGDIVKTGDVVCDIENENIVMEFESVFNGRIVSICELDEELKPGMEVFKIEGI